MQVRIFAALLASAVVSVWHQPQLCSGWRPAESPTDSRVDSGPFSELRRSIRSMSLTTMHGTCNGRNNILFNGNCYPEFTRGHPCGDGQWLVRSTLVPSSSNGICQKRPCGEHKYLWTIPGNGPQTHICEYDDYGPNLNCPHSETGFVNKDEGTGKCDCNHGSIFWEPEKACYALFSRGPCKEGEILYYDPEDKFLSCQTNPCDGEGFTLWEDNKCYRLRDTRKNPCPTSDRTSSYLAINSTTLEVECTEVVTRQFNFISPPVHARNCELSNQAGIALSKCATWQGQGIHSNRVSKGCPKGMAWNPKKGECHPWTYRKVSSSKTHRKLIGGVSKSTMSPTAKTEERSSLTGVLIKSDGGRKSTLSEASFPREVSGAAFATQQVLPLILVSAAAIASSSILLQ